MKYSIIVPVYKNEESIVALISALAKLNQELENELEVIFVVDGSPDHCYELLHQSLPELNFSAQLLVHSRNFGSFAAIRTGLGVARGECFGVMAADLQEPPALMTDFFRLLDSGECDVTIGVRVSRCDPFLSRIASGLFWGLYRRWVIPDMPEGGVDVFGCNRQFRDHLLQLEETRSSLVALIFWLGFRRKYVQYVRQPRQNGKSAWTFSKKVDYMLDSVFAFTDYPIRLLMNLGAVGLTLFGALGLIVFAARILGYIDVPGYAATVLLVLFIGSFNIFGLGIVGTYAWRAYENSKRRPLAVVARSENNKSVIA